MIRGIGVDMVQIREIQRYLEDERLAAPFLRRTFTQREQEESRNRANPAEYLAARFAAKEAVFKALAPLLPEKTFDLRIVETLNQGDGSPFINRTDALRPVLQKAQVDTLHISITTEGDYAAAFVIACGD